MVGNGKARDANFLYRSNRAPTYNPLPSLWSNPRANPAYFPRPIWKEKTGTKGTSRSELDFSDPTHSEPLAALNLNGGTGMEGKTEGGVGIGSIKREQRGFSRLSPSVILRERVRA